ncbi:cell wall-binding repeat-containing protein [Mesobacillus jeotgali]|uniref:cell wall-binding repeat-containing protein n=1 Tax=Mesobacillus jeotgali TaxID=129985 RepID=UPI000C858FAD|nr:cell wall-binding repeat-containing protein [Mesobacillus jeotgali]
MNRWKAIVYLIALIMLMPIFPQNVVGAESNAVNPIQWSSFNNGNPNDSEALRIKEILLNTNKYGLSTWWNEVRDFDSQSSTYLQFGGVLEHEIRHPSAMSLGMATSLAFGLYDPEVTGVAKEEAVKKTVKLVSSLSYRHKANSPGGWGSHWQSAHWANFSGLAGWLIWDKLSAAEREYVRKMVEYEANRLILYQVPYWKDPAGNTVYKGDTKAEENAWNSQILQLATAMMPNHSNWKLWMSKNLELMISSAAMPSDLKNETVVNGKSIKNWISGTNINQDGTVINHGFIHPDYMEFIAFNNTSALHYTLAGMPTPEAAFFNSDIVYKSLVDVPFDSQDYLPPGGTIYREGSSDIYYPEGNDWGNDRRMQFATLDIFANEFGFDGLASRKGDYWEPLHAQKVLDMQNRHYDGRTYAAHEEDTYRGREEWVAHHAAWAWIAKWVGHSGEFHQTNASFGPTYTRVAGAGRYETAAEISSTGWAHADTVLIARGDNFPDALSGTPLAYQLNAPLLLSEKDSLPSATIAEISRLNAEKAVILGGNSAIDKAVQDKLVSLGLKVERIAGGNRFETAAKISRLIDNPSGKAFVVNGHDFPDALAAGTIAAQKGYPVLLVEKERVPFHTAQVLDKSTGAYVVGGKAVIDERILSGIPDSERIAGANRYDTAAKLFNKFNLSSKEVMVANGTSFPDALSGAVLAAKQNNNLLLVEYSRVPSEVDAVLKENGLQHFNVLGGQRVIDRQVVRLLME